MGVSYIKADCEAEHYCSKLCKLNIVDGVVSEDTDTICGSKLVLREFSNKEDVVSCYNLNNILYDLELNYQSFIDLCILLGNDYNNRPRGFSADKVLEIVKKYGSIENLLENNVINNLNFDYNAIRDIIKLNDIRPNIIKLSTQINKKVQLEDLKMFLRENSNIDESTFLHRIKLMYNQKTKGFGSNFKKFNKGYAAKNFILYSPRF